MSPFGRRKRQKYIQPPLSRRDFLKLGGFMGAALLGTFYPVMIERYLVQVNTYRIPLKRLPPAFHGFTIVQLTDIHHGYLTPLEMVRYVVWRANRLGGDIIINTGDNVIARNTTGELDAVWPVLSRLKAPLGVYTVLGNHDHWASSSRSQEWLARSGQDLSHKATVLERQGQRLWLGGTGDLWEDRQSIDEVFAAAPPEACKIVLAHNPNSILSPFQARIDLMISGHTHGGQVRIPIVNYVPVSLERREFSHGLIDTAHGRLFVSRGIGWSVLPFRFNCPPEIAVLVLERA